MEELAAAVLAYLPGNAWDFLWLMAQVITSIIGVCAAAVKLLAAVAKITPTTKDDELASKATRIMGRVSYYLDIVSLGLNAEHARRGKGAGQ